MRTKTCDRNHQAITFNHISEIEECPFCTLVEDHKWGLKEHETEVKRLKEEVNNLKLVILIANKHLSGVS